MVDNTDGDDGVLTRVSGGADSYAMAHEPCPLALTWEWGLGPGLCHGMGHGYDSIDYMSIAIYIYRVQPTVTLPIGDHVNVLHDYKKTGP